MKLEMPYTTPNTLHKLQTGLEVGRIYHTGVSTSIMGVRIQARKKRKTGKKTIA